MAELNLWQRIEAQAHKVPMLQVTIDDGLTIVRWCDLVKTVEELAFHQTHRDVAMFVVDAIEGAGLARFKRSFFTSTAPVSKPVWRGYATLHGREFGMEADGADEHMSLLHCIATLLEFLPEVPRG